MDRDLLRHLPAVLEVARQGSFTRAAGALQMTPSAVSHAVRAVEEGLGVALFARTTRAVRPTEEGAALVASIEPALDDVQRAIDAARSSELSGASGVLRLNLSRVVMPMVMTELLGELHATHPNLVVETYFDDGLADIVGGGFDAGVRLGGMIEADMIALRLTPPFWTSIVGAPSYFERYGRPETIEALRTHACIGYRQISGGGLYRWELEDAGEDLRVDVRGPLIVNDALYAVEAALRGVGLAYVFEPLVREHVEAGRLDSVLEAHAVEEPGLFLYYPQRLARTPKMRALVELVRTRSAR